VGPYLGGHRFKLILTPAQDRHIGAGLRQLYRGRGTDAAPASRDKCRPPF
jgi:hypothetical protein